MILLAVTLTAQADVPGSFNQETSKIPKFADTLKMDTLHNTVYRGKPILRYYFATRNQEDTNTVSLSEEYPISLIS